MKTDFDIVVIGGGAAGSRGSCGMEKGVVCSLETSLT